MSNCRKAWDEPVGYRPDLYGNWIKNDRANRRESAQSETTQFSEVSEVTAFSEVSDVSWMY